MAQLAFYTYAILSETWGHPQVQGFVDRVPGVLESVRGTAGHIWIWPENPPQSPPFMDRTKHGRLPQTLSVWRDMESVYAFAYYGRHLEAFRLRREWMVESEADLRRLVGRGRSLSDVAGSVRTPGALARPWSDAVRLQFQGRL
jgi:hypothetical protein